VEFQVLLRWFTSNVEFVLRGIKMTAKTKKMKKTKKTNKAPRY
jgi:hypothetical protein